MKLYRQISKIIVWVIAVVLLVAAIVITALRITLPYAAEQKPQLTRVAEKSIGKPISIRGVQTGWYGFVPVIILDHVDIFDQAKKKKLWVVPNVQVGIDIWRSIISRHLVVGHIKLTDIYLNIKHDFQHDLNAKSFAQFSTMKISLQNATINWRDSTGDVLVFLHLNGALDLADQMGVFNIKATRLLAVLPKWYDHPVVAQQLSTKITWQKSQDGWRFDFDKLQLLADSVALRGRAVFNLPPHAEPTFYFAASFALADLSMSNQFLPEKLMPKGLVRWLKTALVSGSAKGQVLLRGPMHGFPYTNNQGVFNLIAGIHHATIVYNKLMPYLTAVNATVRMENAKTDIIVRSAKLLDVSLHHLGVTVDADPPSPNKSVEVAMQGQLDMRSLQNYMHLAPFYRMNGKMRFQALLSLHSRGQQSQLLLTSNLQGVKINLPQPFSKPTESKLPLRLRFLFGDQPIDRAFLQLGNQLSAALSYRQGKLTSGNLHIGVGNAVLQTKPGLLIDGTMQSLAWKEWKSIVAAKGQGQSLPVRHVDLQLNKLKAYGYEFAKTHLTLDPKAAQWNIGLKNQQIAGDIIMPHNFPAKPLTADLSYLYWPLRTSTKMTATKPSDIPPMNVSIDNLHYKGKDIGEFDIALSHDKTGVNIDKLVTSAPDYQMSLVGDWKYEDGRMRTSLHGDLQAKNLGTLLKRWQVTTALIGGHGYADFHLNWVGGPTNFNLNTFYGQIGFKFDEGNIQHLGYKAQQEIGIGRLLNILSISSIARHLTLNFKDIAHQGFYFSKLRGNFNIGDGEAETHDMHFEGPVAEVGVKGVLNLIKKSYDLRVAVTPHVTSSLPVLIGIIGTPIAGAVTWAVEKAADPELHKITRHTYHVAGTW